MKNYFYKINQTYIESFFRKIKSVFNNYNIHTDALYLKSILTNINDLFKFLGGQISSKDNIPKVDDYPESKKFNNLITDINYDFQKLFNSQKLIESDVSNLLNFNSSQRTKTYENLTSTQQDVYSLFIKNKKYLGKELLIPSSNPFMSSDNMSVESTGVNIDQNRGVLSLSSTGSTKKPIDVNNIKIFFANSLPDKNVYPNNIVLGIGSHWKIPGRADAHFIGDDQTNVDNYRTMMIDDSSSNTGIGWCEFESVKTIIDPLNNDELYLKNYIASMYQKSPDSIYLDIPNSLQGKYITTIDNSDNIDSTYKLVIPFTGDVVLTNEILIELQPNDYGFYPQIVWGESKVFTNDNGSELSYSLSSPSADNNITDNGEYRCIIKDVFIKPVRLELILKYGTDILHWVKIPFTMSHYSYSAQKTYSLNNDQSEMRLVLNKTYDIFVDTEYDQMNEQARAINVLTVRGSNS